MQSTCYADCRVALQTQHAGRACACFQAVIMPTRLPHQALSWKHQDTEGYHLPGSLRAQCAQRPCSCRTPTQASRGTPCA